MISTDIPLPDVEIVTFRRYRGNGGQHNNKTETAIRITHLPTGIRVEACRERSRSANLTAAWKSLRERLGSIAEDAKSEKQRKEWSSKPDPIRGHWDRSYILHREIRVIDKRTGFRSDNAHEILDGKIDEIIRAEMIHRSKGD